MSGVRGVLDYPGSYSEAARGVHSVNGWEAGLSDELGFVHNLFQFITVLERAGAIPSSDTTGKNAIHAAPAEVDESWSGHVKFPQSPEKVQGWWALLNIASIWRDRDNLLVIWTPKSVRQFLLRPY